MFPQTAGYTDAYRPTQDLNRRRISASPATPLPPSTLSFSLSFSPCLLFYIHTHVCRITYNIHIVLTIIHVPSFIQALTGATVITAVGSVSCSRFSSWRWPGQLGSVFTFSFLLLLRSQAADVVPPALFPLWWPATVTGQHWHQKGRGRQPSECLKVQGVR